MSKTTAASFKEALDTLGFVHRRLPAGDPGNGHEFVHSSEFDTDNGRGYLDKERNISIFVKIDDDELPTITCHNDDGTSFVVPMWGYVPVSVFQATVAAALAEVL